MTTSNKEIIKLTDKDEVTTCHSHRVLLKGVTEDSPVQRELANGKYVILQARNDLDGWTPTPVFAFQVDYGNFSIISITGNRDFATLASEVWHLQFTNKQKTALIKIKKLKKQLSRIERDVKLRIERDRRYKK